MRVSRETELIAALRSCQRLFREALPKFDWGAAALDANAIQLLNEVPGQVARALARVEPPAPKPKIRDLCERMLKR